MTGATARDRAPIHEQALLAGTSETTSWAVALARLENPEQPRTCWLATTRPDGQPHLMPVIGFWIDGAMHVVAGEGSRKARNLADDGRCVIALTSTALPSIDLIVEGRGSALTDEATVSRLAGMLSENNWPLEVEGDKVSGPHAPTAGPPPYTIFRIQPTKIFGLPGMVGMDQFDPADLPKPTRWDFDGD